MPNEFIVKNGLISQGNVIVTGSLTTSGSINTNGTITATTLVVQTITSSISSVTGSTNFGSLVSNTHTFTGSLNVTGSLTVVTTGTEFQVTNTGVNLGNTLTDSHVISGSLTVNPGGLFVSSSGRVGIGVISPASKLEINGFGTANSIMTQPIIAAYATNGFNLGSDGTNALIGVSNSGTDMVFLKRAGGEYSQAMTIASTGQVFIGATSALFNAQVNINYNQSNYEGLAISTDKAYNAQPQPNLIFGGKYNSSGNYRQYATIQSFKDNTTNSDSAASLVFYTNGNSASVTERMRITSAGNVGINYSNPDAFVASSGYGNLVVGSGTGAQGMTIFGGTTGQSGLMFADATSGTGAYTGYVLYSHSTDKMELATGGGTPRVTITSDGVKFQNGATSLNYYEEGTFTPTNLNQNFDAVTVIFGRYVRIGNQVTINCRWNVTANTTGMKYLVFDLPFAFFNNANINFTGIVSNYNNGASSASSNVGTSVRNTNGSTTQQFIEAYYTSTGTAVTLLFSMTYQTF